MSDADRSSSSLPCRPLQVAQPVKPERPEKPPVGKMVGKPDLPDKPAFQEYGSDRPISKVPPFKPSEISKKGGLSFSERVATGSQDI